MKKRLLCMILSAVILLTSFSFVVVAGEADNDYEFLRKLNIVNEIIDFNEVVTRGEFASSVARLCQLGEVNFDTYPVTNSFFDVQKGHKYFNEIQALKDLKIVGGDAFGNFYPDEKITYDDASVMLLNAFGYRLHAMESGGYPSGYLTIGYKVGLFKGIENREIFLSRTNMVKMIYNVLFVDSISIDAIEDNGMVIKPDIGKNILEKHLKVRIIDGTVIDDGFLSLDNQGTIGKGNIILKETNSGNRITLNCNLSDAYQYFGSRVKVYIKENEENFEQEIIHIKPDNDFNKKVINADKIINVNSDYLEYEKENGEFEKIYFTSEKPFVVKNGGRITSFTTDKFYNNSGKITLVDNNGDNKIDFIDIIHFNYNMVCDYVLEEENLITCKVSPIHNLDFSDDSTSIYRIIKNDEIINMSDIKEYDIISVAKSDSTFGGKTIYFLYVSDERREETIVSYSQGENILLTEKDTYEVSNFLIAGTNNFYNKLKFDEPTAFRLDVMGKIAYMEKSAKLNIHYAYIVNMKTQSSYENEPIIYYYDGGEELKSSLVSSKVTIDGERLDGKNISNQSVSSYDELKELLCRQPDGEIVIPDSQYHIKYNKTPSEIIPKPVILKVNSKNEITYIDTQYGLDDSDDPYVLNETKRIFRTESYHKSASTFDGQYFVTGETVILKVPDIDRYGMDDFSITSTNYYESNLFDIENYAIYNNSEMKNLAYDAQAFNVDEDSGVAALLLLRGDASQFKIGNYAAKLAVFDRITQIYDNETEALQYNLYYYLDGKENSVKVNKDKLHIFYNNIIFGGLYPEKIDKNALGEIVTYKNVEGLKQGDIISLEETNGYLTQIQRELDISNINKKPVSGLRPTAPANPYSIENVYKDNTGFPFDQRYYALMPSYSESYLLELFLPYNLSGNTLRVRLPLNALGSNVGTFSDYYSSGYTNSVLEKYIMLEDNLAITLIEETGYDPVTKDGVFKISQGKLTDLKLALLNDINKSSRVFAYSTKGSYTQFIIINLLPEHNDAQ